MTEDPTPSDHPLEGCDPDDCYKTMMEERRALDTARRESEDNVVKNVIQIAAALIVVIAGFITQQSFALSKLETNILTASLAAFTISIICGLAEQFLTGRAYSQQLVAMEAYYQRQTTTYDQPAANRYVRLSQLATIAMFVVAIGSLAFVAVSKAQGKLNDRQATSGSDASASAEPTTR